MLLDKIALNIRQLVNKLKDNTPKRLTEVLIKITLGLFMLISSIAMVMGVVLALIFMALLCLFPIILFEWLESASYLWFYLLHLSLWAYILGEEYTEEPKELKPEDYF